jgi:hypothetical protein
VLALTPGANDIFRFAFYFAPPFRQMISFFNDLDRHFTSCSGPKKYICQVGVESQKKLEVIPGYNRH